MSAPLLHQRTLAHDQRRHTVSQGIPSPSDEMSCRPRLDEGFKNRPSEACSHQSFAVSRGAQEVKDWSEMFLKPLVMGHGTEHVRCEVVVDVR